MNQTAHKARYAGLWAALAQTPFKIGRVQGLYIEGGFFDGTGTQVYHIQELIRPAPRSRRGR